MACDKAWRAAYTAGGEAPPLSLEIRNFGAFVLIMEGAAPSAGRLARQWRGGTGTGNGRPPAWMARTSSDRLHVPNSRGGCAGRCRNGNGAGPRSAWTAKPARYQPVRLRLRISSSDVPHRRSAAQQARQSVRPTCGGTRASTADDHLPADASTHHAMCLHGTGAVHGSCRWMCPASATVRDHSRIRQLEAVQSQRRSAVQVNISLNLIIPSMRLPRIGIIRPTRRTLPSLFNFTLGLARIRCRCNQGAEATNLFKHCRLSAAG